MNKKEAEDYVYRSYLKAAKYQEYATKDKEKRNPALTREIITGLSVTPCAIVTGSKGKGSVTCIISQILQTEFKTGMMTSPHITDFCERFRIDGKAISDEEFITHMQRIIPHFDQIEAGMPCDKSISPMGIQAALALDYFNTNNTQFNVFECGKGARFDDVNNIPHQYAVINSIFLEHTRELGETLAEIAFDKSHVITGGQKCVYIAEQKPEAMETILERANHYNIPVKVYGRDFHCSNIRYTKQGMLFNVTIGNKHYDDITVPLLGEHQAKNCALAMALCKDIMETFDIDRIKASLKSLSWPGRMEILSTAPFIMLDACINSESTGNIKKILDYLDIARYTLIVGIPDDKDYAKVVKAMYENAAEIILTKSQNPHYVFTESQKYTLANDGIETIWTCSIPEAIDIALKKGLPTVILGTTSVVSEVKVFFEK